MSLGANSGHAQILSDGAVRMEADGARLGSVGTFVKDGEHEYWIIRCKTHGYKCHTKRLVHLSRKVEFLQAALSWLLSADGTTRESHHSTATILLPERFYNRP